MCKLSLIKSKVVCNAIAGSGVAELWAYLSAHTTAMLLRNNDIIIGYDTVGEKGDRRGRKLT